MSLMYVAKRSRPDILKEIVFLATRVSCATSEDWSKLLRVNNYLNGTIDKKFVLAPKTLQICASVDASYSIHADSKGHSGMTISFGKDGPVVLVRSVKQKLVAISSTEAELIALDDAICYVLWCRELMDDLGFKQVGPCDIQQDNTSAMAICIKGNGYTGRTRHMNNRFYFIKQHLENGDVQLVHTGTDDINADGLTKPVVGQKFKRFVDAVLGV